MSVSEYKNLSFSVPFWCFYTETASWKQGLNQCIFVFSSFLAQIWNYEEMGSCTSNLYLFQRLLSSSNFLSQGEMAAYGNLRQGGLEKQYFRLNLNISSVLWKQHLFSSSPPPSPPSFRNVIPFPLHSDSSKNKRQLISLVGAII